MAKKILVTGGCGYIGSVLVPQMLQRGYEVRVFDKLYFGEETLTGVLDKIELAPGDVRDFDPAILDGIDGVIHLGGLSNDPTAEFDPKANYSINYDATVSLATACKERGIERFTFASGCAVYGFFLDGIADETFPTHPQSDYAQSKLDAELALQKMADDSFCPVCIRQGTVYGFSPRMRWDLAVNAFVMRAFQKSKIEVWFGGEAWRPMVHITDVARAHIACLEADAAKVKGQIFNLVYDNFRILELAHRVRDAMAEMGIKAEVDVNYDQQENRSYNVSGEKLKKAIGFVPAVSVEEAAKEIVTALRSGKNLDFDHPIYYNLPWMKLLVDIESRINKTGKVL